MGNFVPHVSLAQAISVILAIVLPGTAASFDQRCAEFGSTLDAGNATIESISFVPAGTTLNFTDVDGSCGYTPQEVSVDLCRMQLTVPTSSRSGFFMEAWLPRNWTGRYLATGNGGIAGCVTYSDMAYAAALGFASVGTNNGHNGQNLTTALDNDDVVEDFAWRALYQSTVMGKSITASFYNRPHNTSYYLGCSTGGRQGFDMAQSFPDLFDGIVAGSPALNFNNLTSWSGMFHAYIAEAGTDGYPPPSTWGALDAALLEQCDKLDGAEDGILEDPSLCNFKPEVLICPENVTNTSTCITGKQAQTVRTVLSTLYGVNGSLVYPRMQPGPGIIATVYAVYAASQFLYTDHWFKYVIYNNPNFNSSFLTPNDMLYAWNKNPASIATWNGDLSHFRAHGAKILHYHGQVDPIITSADSNHYYDYVSQTMNIPHTDMDDFYRFFRISGMGHCNGGVGATVIGNGRDGYYSLDPDHNVLLATVRWVETGVAPTTITGTHFVNETVSLGVDFERNHCRYPYRNMHTGTGDAKDPSSWECIL